VGLEGDLDTGEGVEAVQVAGVEFETEVGDGSQGGRDMRIGGGQHSGSGGGGFGEGRGLIEHGDAVTTAVEFEGEGETDDAGSGDADVGIRRRWVVHEISLVGRRSYSLGLSILRADA